MVPVVLSVVSQLCGKLQHVRERHGEAQCHQSDLDDFPGSLHRSAVATADCVTGTTNGDIKKVVCISRFTGWSPH